MRLSLFLSLAAIVLLPRFAAAAHSQWSCPVTAPAEPAFTPPFPYATNLPKGVFWYGSNELWTVLWHDGIWRGLPHDRTGYSNKLFLWHEGYDYRRHPTPDIHVALRHLDSKAPLVLESGGTNAFLENNWAMLTGVTFPTEGCWEVSSVYEGHVLRFVVLVQP